MRIALVNDVPMAIEALRRIVTSLPDAEVAWIAQNGQEACDKCEAERPDVILMDLLMPIMDGVEATRKIMQCCPCPILVVTATVTGNCAKVYEALGHGALDAVNTPVLGRDGKLAGADELVRKIRTVMRLQCGRAAGLEISKPPPERAQQPATASSPLVVLGASTGGPQALAEVLSGLLRPLPFSIVIVQHLDPLFVPGLAEWLSQETGLPVEPVTTPQTPQIGVVHVACTNDHLVLDYAGRLAYEQQPADHVYRPSVDVFFDSLLRARVPSGVAALLTGMGRDGAAGLKALKQSGWKTIVQDEDTSIVWGMPGAGVRIGAADRVLPLGEIGAAITEAMSTTTGS